MNVLTAQEVADLFRIQKQQVIRLTSTRKWPHHKIGRFTRFTDEDISKIEEITQVNPTVVEVNRFGRRV